NHKLIMAEIIIPDATTKQNTVLAEIFSDLTVSAESIRLIIDQFLKEMTQGLAEDGHNLAMIPSFVTDRPTGREKGTYLALDFGGTNLRVCEVILDGKGAISVRQQKYTISEELKKQEGKQLFEFVAQCVSKFLIDQKTDPARHITEQMQLGF